MALEVRAAQPEDIAQAIAVLDGAWAWQNNEAMLTLDPGYKMEQTRLGLVDGRVVTVVQVFHRTMWLEGQTAKVGAVGNVATAPEHRLKGYARAVLQDAIAYMQEQDYDLSMLFTGKPAVYSRLGWRPVPERVTTFALGPDLPASTPGDRARQGDWDRDLEAVAAVYDGYNAGRTGAVLRTLDYWSASRLWLPNEDDGRFLVVERDGRIVAYARGDKSGRLIMEAGYQCRDALPCLFRAIRERFAPGQIAAHFHADAAIDAYLAAHAVDVEAGSRVLPGAEPPMFRPVKRQNLSGVPGFCFYATDHF